ncbi:Bifunctional DNA primase/polymerase [Rubidibacter lacunae KORDI 51-2]|uniref:Bifunctional DNA primase/polymerase n=1 Tax=Rubidibacter lacunae KORDI 51-2 TaxID=582515 RepID=U5DKC8_9CHRO|nr:AAA family ATPase [Rubidibacter lacunae]ERN41372.1 Bifunctional DNA primase/polymerase [Rubidibacter lacunae KORDI 51-2]
MGALDNILRQMPDELAWVAVGRNKAPYLKNWSIHPLSKQEVVSEIAAGRCHAIGVLCGTPSGGLLFVDVDGASCDRLVEKLSGLPLAEALPKTVGVTSGRPGRCQLIYRVTREHWDAIATRKLKAAVPGEGLELRWDGCQSVVTGHHPQTDGYRFLPGQSFEECAIAPAPGWMLQQMQPQTSLTASWQAFDRQFRLPVNAAVPLYCCLSRENRHLFDEGVPQGCRDNSGARLTRDLLGTAGYLAGIGQMFEGDPRQMLDTFCQRCSPPLSERDGDRLWKSAVKDNPGPSLSPEQIEGCIKGWLWRQRQESAGKPPAIAPDSPADFQSTMTAVGKILQIPSRARQTWELNQLARRLRQPPDSLRAMFYDYQHESHDFAPRDVHDFLASRTEERQWLVAGYISAATTIVLYADGGTGKTLLAYDLIKAIASGRPWNGFRTQQVKCLLVQTDEPEIDTRERLDIAGYAEEVKRGWVAIEQHWQFSQMHQLRLWITRERPGFVVIDSLTSANRAATAEEKDTTYASSLYDLVDLANDFGCTFLVLHHENKGGAVRGTTAIRNNVSEVWHLRRPKPAEVNQGLGRNHRILDVEKSRSGCSGNYTLELNVEDYSWSYQGEHSESVRDERPLSARLLDYLELHHGIRYEPQELLGVEDLGGATRDTIRKSLERLRKKGLVEAEHRLKDNGNGQGGKTRYKVYFVPDARMSPRAVSSEPETQAGSSVESLDGCNGAQPPVQRAESPPAEEAQVVGRQKRVNSNLQVGDRCRYCGPSGSIAVTCRGRALEVLAIADGKAHVKAPKWAYAYDIPLAHLRTIKPA